MDVDDRRRHGRARVQPDVQAGHRTRSTSTQPQPEQGRPTAGSAAAKAPEEAEAPDKTPRRPADDPNAGRDAAKDVALQEEEAKAMADLLTGEGANGTSEGDMSKRRPGADLGQQIADVREGGKTGRRRRWRRSRLARRRRCARRHRQGPEHQRPGRHRDRRRRQGRARADRPHLGQRQADVRRVDADARRRARRRSRASYMAGLKRCYKEYLKKDAARARQGHAVAHRQRDRSHRRRARRTASPARSTSASAA